MDYVYICRDGDNEELKYSIRSITKHLPDVNVWVLGYKPDWYIGNFKKIDNVGGKFANIVNCIHEICNIEEISEDFVLMNDDFFVLENMESIPTYHGGSLLEKIDRIIHSTGSNSYTRLLIKTYKNLKRFGIKDPIDYDVHLPLPMTKSGLAKSKDIAYFPRSAYGNVVKVGGIRIERDVKVYNGNRNSYDYKNPVMPFVSTLDESFDKVYNDLLKDLFIEPSIYEIA